LNTGRPVKKKLPSTPGIPCLARGRHKKWGKYPYVIPNSSPKIAANAAGLGVRLEGSGKLDIVVSNGITFPMQGGVSTTHPGVMSSSALKCSFTTVRLQRDVG
jgi:hypothetical protein